MAWIKESEETSALDTGIKELTTGTLKADVQNNFQDALSALEYANLAGCLGAITCTASGLDVTIPDDSAYFALMKWTADGAHAESVPDSATTYLWGCADGEIRQTDVNSPPGGFTARTACLIVKCAASGTVTLDHSVQQLARSSDAASRTVAEGGAAKFDYANKTFVLLGGERVSINKQTLSGNLTLTKGSAVYQQLNPNGSDRDVTLYASPAAGDRHKFKHDSGANTITIKNSGGSTVTTLTTGQVKEIVYDGAAWGVW